VRNTDPTSAPVLQGSERTAARAAGDYVTLVEVLELTRPFEEFAAAVGPPPVGSKPRGLGSW
jgi:hypothetical protein